MDDLTKKLLKRAWDSDTLADVDTIDIIVSEILANDKQYFTSEEIVELLTKDF